ncbi:Ig-like domain-containing protein [uncultured Sunxiuqinia sp.]|uniref:Ig-like domain-containing protein n=1 Tax=uncultured Sunxiuqinia sp. TaxID=1573825 RepID=UPI002AA8F34A|nr:Ig-like domain-containing protein [uncultured Sunxiuqinia sp.]
MRKSFTRLFSFMLMGMLIFAVTAVSWAQPIGTPPQQTITTSVDDVTTVCYNEDNSYKVQVSVIDFVNLDSLDLVLDYTLGDFDFVGATWLSAGATSGLPLDASPAYTSVTETTPGEVRIVWTDNVATHHEIQPDDSEVAILELEFQVVNATPKTVYTTTMSWDLAKSKYYWEGDAGQEAVNSLEFIGGVLNAKQIYTPAVDVGDSDALCFGGNVDVEVTLPAGSNIEYLFNDNDIAGGSWTSNAKLNVTAPSVNNTVIARNTDTGCISHMLTFDVGSADPLVFDADSSDAECYGGNGEIQFLTDGGTAPYTYWVVPAANFSAVVTKLINNPSDATLDAYKFSAATVLRPAGMYYIAVDDANGCAKLLNDAETGSSTYWMTATIAEESIIDTTSAAVVDVTCYGGNDGSISVTATGGAPKVAGYTFKLNGGSSAVGTSKTYSGLAGSYTVTIMDSLCSRDFEFYVDQPEAVTFTIDYKDVACNVTPDGQIWVDTINGVAVDDVNSAAWSFEVFNALGGSEGVTTVGDTLAGLDPAYYTLVLTDAAGCTYDYMNSDGTDDIPVMSPAEISYTPVVTYVDCNGSSTGEIVLTSLRGAANYEFQLDGGSWSADQSIYDNLAAGTYLVNVRDADNTDRCEISQSIIIEEPTSAISITLVEDNQPTCPKGNDGNVSIDVSGGTPFLDSNDDPYYMYSVDGAPYFVGNPTFALTEGDHDISVKDMNGCEETTTVTIDALDPETISASAPFIDCYGDVVAIDTSIVSQSYAFNPDYYTLYVNTVDETGGVEFKPADEGVNADLFPAGTYYISSMSPNGCWSNVVELVIEQSPELELVDVTVQNATCNEYWDGFISVQVTGGTAISATDRYEYAVANNPVAFSNPGSTISWESFFNDDADNDSTTIIQVLEGTYYIGVRDSCQNIVQTEAITITSAESITIGDVAITNVTCYDEEDGEIDVTGVVIGGNGDYRYTLYNYDHTNSSTGSMIGSTKQASPVYSDLAAGFYKLVVDDTTEPVSCPADTTVLFVNTPSELTLDLDSLHVSCYGEEDGEIMVTISGGVGGTYGYFEDHANNYQDPDYTTDGNKYKVTINNTDPNGVSYGTYSFADDVNSKTFQVAAGKYVVQIQDAHGCSVIDSVMVEQPDMWQLTTSSTLPSDCGAADGTITVDIQGGWPGEDLEIKLDNGSWVSVTGDSHTFTGIEFGEYDIMVRNSSFPVDVNTAACYGMATETLTEPSEFAYVVNIESAKCHGDYNGKMIITDVTGGSGKYQFQLVSHNNTSYQPTNDDLWEPKTSGGTAMYVTEYTFDTLDAGHYTLYIRDDAGYTLSSCGALESWEVEEPDSLEITETMWLKDVTCNGGDDGSFEIQVQGGTAPYLYAYTESQVSPDPEHPYQMMPDVNDASLWQDSPVFEDVTSGTFIAWVVDANGCFQGGEIRSSGAVIDQHRVVIDQPVEIDLDLDGTMDATCYGVEDGKIYIDYTTGGNGSPYTFKVEGPKYDGTTVSYMFTNNGNGYTSSATLSGVFASLPDPDNNSEMYAVTAIDKLGCESDPIYVSVEQPEEFVIEAVIDEDAFICANDLSGILDIVTVSGGTSPFMYQVYRNDVLVRTWTSNNSHVVESGYEYIVEAEDDNGCMSYDTIMIETPEPVVIADIRDLTCYGEVSPTVRITATAEEGRDLMVRYQKVEGASTVGPWSSWTAFNEEDGTATHVYSSGLTYGDDNESDGHYNFQVKDEFGCISEVVFETFVPVQNELTATFTVDGTVLTISDIDGGISPYMLMVDGVDVGAVGEEVVVDSLIAGANVITIMDSHECVADTTVTIEDLMVTADPASGDAMAQEFDVVLTFNREVTIVDGDITGGTVTPGTGTEFTVAMTGADGDDLTLTVGSTIMDMGGNAFAGTTFTYTIGDNTGPMPATYTPEDGATIADNHPTLKVTFNEDVVAGSGNVYITKVGGTTPVLTIPLTAGMVDGSTVTVDYTYDPEVGGLNKNTEYYVTFDAGLVADAAGNKSLGLTDDTVWNFITGDFATGVEEPSGSLEYKVYPNPFDGFVTVDNADKLSRIVVTNVAGQRVKDIVSPNTNIDLGDLRSGIYLMTLITKDDVVAKTERLVKK